MKNYYILFLSLIALNFNSQAQCIAGQKQIIIEINPDNYPQEITWVLRENGIQVGNGAFAGDTICVAETACIQFSIYDSANDGICCGFGAGSYNLYVDGALVNSGGDYGSGNAADGDELVAGRDAVSVFAPGTGDTGVEHQDAEGSGGGQVGGAADGGDAAEVAVGRHRRGRADSERIHADFCRAGDGRDSSTDFYGGFQPWRRASVDARRPADLRARRAERERRP